MQSTSHEDSEHYNMLNIDNTKIGKNAKPYTNKNNNHLIITNKKKNHLVNRSNIGIDNFFFFRRHISQ